MSTQDVAQLGSGITSFLSRRARSLVAWEQMIAVIVVVVVVFVIVAVVFVVVVIP